MGISPMFRATVFATTFLVGFSVSVAASGGDVPAPAAIPLDQAAARMKVPDGFEVKLFAGEPDVRQPIALTFDTKGRLWVAECYSYPEWELSGGVGKDRVVIFEDSDSDGHFDKRTVFLDKIANLSGLEVGFGGVWLCATPNLLFVPDANSDDVPDGPAQVVLDGWDLKARHNVFNSLTWGPDGWLYGCNGILSNSKVGPPGTPDNARMAINCGVWRWHPTRKVIETVANGTTNPWGLDFDDYGQAFITNCVIPHLFHVTPGGHYQRMFGQDYNPNLYDLIPSCADHVHWDTIEHWTDIRTRGVTPTTDRAGGGHAHSGAAISLGDNWPDRYRNTILMGNIHGRRLNNDSLEPKGSGYQAKHLPDFLLANDPWFRGIALKFGPDGALYLIDWSDTGECHETDADGAHRENGRIYRVAFGTPKRSVEGDLATLETPKLVALQGHKHDWVVRQSRRLLQERSADGSIAQARDSARAELRDVLQSQADAPKRLRALWALFAIGALTEPELVSLTHDPVDHLRGWAIRLLVDDTTRPLSDETLKTLADLSRADASPRVRLALASTLRRLPAAAAGRIAEGLIYHGEDAGDPNLPLMIWYGIEGLVGQDLSLAAGWATTAELSKIRENLGRLVANKEPSVGLDVLAERLSKLENPEPAMVHDVLKGISRGLQGHKRLAMPKGWGRLLEKPSDVFKRPEIRQEADKIGLFFGDADSARRLKALMADRSASTDSRVFALKSLAEGRITGLPKDMIGLLDDPALRIEAIRSLAAFDDPAISGAILSRYKSFDGETRDHAVNTLAARPSTAIELLKAVGSQAIPRRDISVTVARQLLALNRPEINEALNKSWGTIRATSAEKARLLPLYKSKLGSEALKAGDRASGRGVFQRVCQQCHKLYGEGGIVGPELTGSNRDNLDYLLENILDPSASVGSDYKLTTIATADGRLLSGMIRNQNQEVLVVQTANDQVVIPRSEIEELRPSQASMMPEGLLEGLSETEVRDLISYLADRSAGPRPSSK